MIFQLSATLLAGCAVRAAADAPADRLAAAPPPATRDLTTKDLLSAPTNRRDDSVVSDRQHRLLKRFKKRKERRLHAQTPADAAPAGGADVGVLSSSKNGRFLDEESDFDYYCPRETCPAELCDCADTGGSLEDCTSELQSVCRAGQLEGCVFSDYVGVYEEVYCPFVNCVGGGFRENQCDCAFYELYCERLGSNECAPYQTDEPDKKPFFGCDETEMANVCSEAKRCKGNGDLQGLPELGTWKGSGQVGIKKNAGGRMGGAGAVAGVALLSVLWFAVNA